MTIRFATALLAILIVATAAAQVESPYPAGTELYVEASALALRRGPGTNYERIHFIPKGDRVAVLPDTAAPVPFEAEGKKGHWVHIQHGQHKGYVFDGFLTAATPAVETRTDWKCIPGERAGPITHDTTLDDLVGFFGAENVVDGKWYLGEGDYEPATVILPNTPNAATILWKSDHKRVVAVRIEGEGSPWRLPNGIGIGTSLNDLEGLNGRPFQFSGFGWDYAGGIIDWRGGSLSENCAIGTLVSIKLIEGDVEFNDPAYMALLGDDVFTSDMPAAKQLNPRVGRIDIVLAPPQPATPPAPTYPNALASLPAPSPDTVLYVIGRALNLRDEPSLNGEIVGRLPYASQVMAAAAEGERAPVVSEGFHGHWLKVKAPAAEGYVSDAYLIPFPPPPQGIRGLWSYADAVFDRDGKPAINRTGTRADGTVTTTQRYANGVTITDRHTSTSTLNAHETTLTIPGISPEHAFLIAQRCIGGLGGLPFVMEADGRLQLRTPDNVVTITSRTAGQVQITESNRIGR